MGRGENVKLEGQRGKEWMGSHDGGRGARGRSRARQGQAGTIGPSLAANAQAFQNRILVGPRRATHVVVPESCETAPSAHRLSMGQRDGRTLGIDTVHGGAAESRRHKSPSIGFAQRVPDTEADCWDTTSASHTARDSRPRQHDAHLR